MFWDQNLTVLFHKAGFTRWPLLLCSITATAIMIERSYYYFRLRFNYPHFSQGLFSILRNNQIKEAKAFCYKHPNPVPQMAGIYLENVHNKLRNSVLTREGSLAIERIENRLKGLAVITHIAPLLGLLGTVSGLVSAFHQIELVGGQVQAENLAAGIWEALLSTVFGLIVAIPCMVAYHLFESYADRMARRIQFIVSELDEFFEIGTDYDLKKDHCGIDDEGISVVQ